MRAIGIFLRVSALGMMCLGLPDAQTASASTQVVPAAPIAFEPINLRLTVDSCAFNPGSVQVSSSNGVIRLTQTQNNCLAPGVPIAVDVRVGSFPVGRYRVEIHSTPQPTDTPVETFSFEVVGRAEIAIFPPPPRPLADYTGLWWNPQQSGWGLSLHQSAFDTLVGAWFAYGANGQPEWFTLQGGRWTSFTTWTGSIYRSTGPAFPAADFDPRLVLILPAGSATLEFGQMPHEGHATFTYTMSGVTRTVSITRLRF